MEVFAKQLRVESPKVDFNGLERGCSIRYFEHSASLPKVQRGNCKSARIDDPLLIFCLASVQKDLHPVWGRGTPPQLTAAVSARGAVFGIRVAIIFRSSSQYKQRCQQRRKRCLHFGPVSSPGDSHLILTWASNLQQELGTSPTPQPSPLR